MTEEIFEGDLEFGDRAAKLAAKIVDNNIKQFTLKDIQGGGEGDKLFSTDWIVDINGRQQHWAVKIRRAKFQNYDDVTVELMNGTYSGNPESADPEDKGDYYRFKQGGVDRYLYGWMQDEEHIGEFYIFDAQKLLETPLHSWRGDTRKDFPGFDGALTCKQNERHGDSWFTVLPLANIPVKAHLAKFDKHRGFTIRNEPKLIPKTNQKGLGDF